MTIEEGWGMPEIAVDKTKTSLRGTKQSHGSRAALYSSRLLRASQ
jgi:hypothetical protein